MWYLKNLPYLVHSGLDISMRKNDSEEHKTTDKPKNIACSQERFKVKPVLTSLAVILPVTLNKKKSWLFDFPSYYNPNIVVLFT